MMHNAAKPFAMNTGRG